MNDGLKKQQIFMKRIAIFASGEGTNAEAITRYFNDRTDVRVVGVFGNRMKAGVFKRLSRYGIDSYYFSSEEWTKRKAENVLRILTVKQVDLVVLAGFLLVIPEELVEAYRGRIINIHPSLLPKYGGRGMWGMKVHEAVLDAKEAESGITIHYVDNEVDGGEIIFQATCPVLPEDTPEDLANRVHALEHHHFPRVVDGLLRD